MHKGNISLFVVLLAACSRGDATTQSQRETTVADRGIRVVVAKPSPVTEHETIVLPGTLEPFESARLFARATGYLSEVTVDIGAVVTKGQPLAHIVMPDVTARTGIARAQRAAAAAAVVRTKSELSLAKITHERRRALRQKNPGAISQQDVDMAAGKWRIKQTEVKLAQARLMVATAKLNELYTLSKFGVIAAPFNGRITRRVLHPGALVRAGTASGARPVVYIARTNPLRLSFEVPEPLVPQVRAGQSVAVRIKAFHKREIKMTIARVAGTLDATTRSMRAEIDVPNPDQRYKPGMYASVSIEAKPPPGALRIASRAIGGSGSKRYVFVVRKGVLARVPVIVASDDGKNAFVVSGVSTADDVVVVGSPLARPGMRVDSVAEKTK